MPGISAHKGICHYLFRIGYSCLSTHSKWTTDSATRGGFTCTSWHHTTDGWQARYSGVA